MFIEISSLVRYRKTYGTAINSMPLEVSQVRQVMTFFEDTLVVLVVMGDTIEPQSLQQ